MAEVASLGFTALDTFRIGCFYALFTLKDRLGLQPALRGAKKVTLAHNGVSFPFFIRRQIDFDTLKSTFISDEYHWDIRDDSIDVIFDLGSNIGSTVIYYAILYPKATIFAFEPDPENVEMLKKNTEYFASRVRVSDEAITGKDGQELVFYKSSRFHWSSSLAPKPGIQQEIRVKTTSIDALMETNHLSKVDLVKFDIEGAEFEAFEKCKRLEQIRYMVGEFHPTLCGKSLDEFLDLFQGFGHKTQEMGKIVQLTKK